MAATGWRCCGAEQPSFAKLMVTPTAQNLIRVFFLREQMKKLAGSGNKIEHVHVIGAGAMGGDIAAWCAGQDMRVTLADMKAEPIAGAIKRAADLYGKILRKRTSVRDALDRLMPDMQAEGVRNADLIIEAVPEKLELKQKVYAGPRAENEAGRDPCHQYVEHSAAGSAHHALQKPERLLGLHFFNPVSRLQLVEVVSHDGTDAQLLKEALAFVGAIDRLPLPVKSSPGFLVNRALTPYMLEAMVMLDEKIDKSVIDAAAKKFGMPMGPIELADQVGLDICLDVGDMLRSKFGDMLPPTPAWLREKVANGELGRKTGKGFYTWKDGKADTGGMTAISEPSAEMIDRLILPMSNVCVACLREGIVDNADVVDGAVIFGTGYAPFRGGPLNYARTRGVENVVCDAGGADGQIRRQVYAGCRLGEFQVANAAVFRSSQPCRPISQGAASHGVSLLIVLSITTSRGSISILRRRHANDACFQGCNASRSQDHAILDRQQYCRHPVLRILAHLLLHRCRIELAVSDGGIAGRLFPGGFFFRRGALGDGHLVRRADHGAGDRDHPRTPYPSRPCLWLSGKCLVRFGAERGGLRLCRDRHRIVSGLDRDLDADAAVADQFGLPAVRHAFSQSRAQAGPLGGHAAGAAAASGLPAGASLGPSSQSHHPLLRGERMGQLCMRWAGRLARA